MHEFPLVLFTLLMQGAVGVMLMLCLTAGLMPRAGHMTLVTLPALLGVGVAAGLGLLTSTLHLGYPLNAFNALRHLSSSWLSREIALAGVFMALLGISVLLLMMKRRAPWPLLWLVTLAGLADIAAMASIYCHASVVTWQHVNTWAMFLGSVVVTGASITLLRLALRPLFNAQTAQALNRRLSLLALTAVLIRLLVQPAYDRFLAHAVVPVTFPLQSLAAFDASAGLRLAGWCCSVGGALLLMVNLTRPHGARSGQTTSCLLLLLGELLLRLAFFCINV
ncbi:dimethyl sulfoxide reductase anchor subunit family protein [Cronobacter muytjensii]|uniref:dimethyl sulfoxide reductase anchor subunit family protein n=1 Tax=Cronobacter muytjensii TaxID=413501 RepID=UPI001587F966|nr:DmsC/YnfH family molybdoenzyme membrane anchor subunit [Cronobacter muytjensii]NUW57974.1 dimethyl sulfoxide reductase anchor subunit [Cronobacter muytjensii]